MSDLFIRTATILEIAKPVEQLMLDFWAAREPDDSGQPPTEMQWKDYVAMEKLGKVTCFVAIPMDGVGFVGISIYFVVQSLHHRDYISAICDCIYTHPSVKGKGIGEKMIQYAEKFFRSDLRISAMAQGYRPVHDVDGKPRDGMLRRNGFLPGDALYIKRF